MRIIMPDSKKIRHPLHNLYISPEGMMDRSKCFGFLCPSDAVTSGKGFIPFTK